MTQQTPDKLIKQFKKIFPDVLDSQFKQGRFGLLFFNDFLEFNAERFLSKAKLGPNCELEWQGPVHESGWPMIGIRLKGQRRMINARRLIAMVRLDNDLTGYQVLSTCHNPRCITYDRLGVVEDPSAGKTLPWAAKTGRKKQANG